MKQERPDRRITMLAESDGNVHAKEHEVNKINELEVTHCRSWPLVSVFPTSAVATRCPACNRRRTVADRGYQTIASISTPSLRPTACACETAHRDQNFPDFELVLLPGIAHLPWGIFSSRAALAWTQPQRSIVRTGLKGQAS
jgi:hypothetical protein